MQVKNLTISRFCGTQTVTAVNGSVPGPTIKVRENDTLVVHVINASPHNLTIHWHGIFQIGSQWADGPEYVTQCPIRPGQNYTYRFTITGQEGTLWWHAHNSFLRTTVYGALIIRPTKGHSYPFTNPYREVPILLGEWWKADIMEIANQIQVTGDLVPPSDAFNINGYPGDLYNCSQDRIFNLKVTQGDTYMLRIINTNLITQMFFKIANHNFTVVAVDAEYTTPYATDVVVVAPGQTTDVLLKADQPVGSYYMAASGYITTVFIGFDNTTTRGILVYDGASNTTTPLMPNGSSNTNTPLMPVMPALNDTPTAHKFYTNITGLKGGPHWANCPRTVDEQLFVTFGMGLDFCPTNQTCLGPSGFKYSASMNNESFVLPSTSGTSMLEAMFNNNVSGVYTRDFPNTPPLEFDYTSPNNSSLIYAPKSTKVKTLKFNSTVEIVFQNTAILGGENHPMHIHGFNFHVLAQGFGNYNASIDEAKFNFVDPQIRNTIAVPFGGWAVVRFTANNPGIWMVHCHLDVHLPWGLAMAFEVENGPTPSTTLPPPPSDLPKC
ncbi:laccase-7-like [Senna tora]|uniref:Laccase n=1 Tax=Senna tora TaxID=362788 RepID=A0A834XHX1_9FABA|nr:laccase-7-like [Senna tora]